MTEATIKFTAAKKKIDPKNKTMLVQLDFEGDIKTGEDAMTLFADWFCSEVSAMGFDPVTIISEINRMRAD